MTAKSVEYNWHAPDLSQLEAVLARGDRRLCRVLEEVVYHGGRLDGWDDYFDYQIWLDAFAACGIDPAFYTTRGYGKDEIFPWQTISVGVDREFFWREREQAYCSQTTPDCRVECSACGANALCREVGCDV